MGEGRGEGLPRPSRLPPATPAKYLPRTICFVTGTRAEFGLMQATLRAIQSHPGLRLQLVATGMHLDPAHGRTVDTIRKDGWTIDAAIPWKPAKDNRATLARQTGLATSGLAAAYARLDPDIILVTGDRVEAFAAATAAHLSGRVLAHVHGGDRAQGQVDDALRHAITKLAHVHFPATKQSADRIARLGEDAWRIYQVGSPGLDAITRHALPLDDCNALLGGMGKLVCPWSSDPQKEGRQASTLAHATLRPLRRHRYALLLLHPTDAADAIEYDRANLLLRTTQSIGFDHVVIVYPNNDPGAAGILRAWQSPQIRNPKSEIRDSIPDLPRPAFLGLLRDAAVLVGNSSAGIIEAASFGTPVLDVGTRQAGRERGQNVTNVPFRQAPLRQALRQIWNDGRPRRYPKRNVYGSGDTARLIAKVLASIPLTARLRQKLITY